MALIPYALRPKTIIRRTAIKRAATGGGLFWRALTIYFVRGPKVLRSQAMMRGLGGDRKWRVVAIVAFVTQDIRSAITRQPEFIAEERMRPGQFLSVVTSKPLSRKEQKRTGITRRVLERQALSDVAAAKAADPAS